MHQWLTIPWPVVGEDGCCELDVCIRCACVRIIRSPFPIADGRLVAPANQYARRIGEPWQLPPLSCEPLW